MKGRRRWLGAIVLGVIVLLFLFATPQSASLRQGSTYSRSPSGYGAWYAAMQAQGADIQRWQKPIDQLIDPTITPGGEMDQESVPIVDQSPAFSPTSPTTPLTLLQISNGQTWATVPLSWIEQGNVFIQVGSRLGQFEAFNVRTPVTEAPFTSQVSSPSGAITLETSRRFAPLPAFNGEDLEDYQPLLADRYGAIVLGQKVGQGRIVAIITPHLAANAYQDAPGNFQFLTQLVTEPGYPILVDEYIHGYQDTEAIAADSPNLVSYLARTPLLLIAIQAAVIGLVLIWGLNRRLGPPTPLTSPPVDNSRAYIEALATVLRKANCSEFVVNAIGKAEQLQVQRALGLGTDLLDPDTVRQAWSQQTEHSTLDLEALLQGASHPHRLSESELLIWLEKVRSIRHRLFIEMNRL